MTNEIKHKKLPLNTILYRGFFITLGAVIMALALEVFLIPNDIMDGGITGISIILSHLTGLNLGIFLFLLNLPFLFLGYKQIGKTFAISATYGIIVLSVSTTLMHHIPAYHDDTLLIAIFGGIILGLGVGLAIRFGGALDGAEALAILISKKTPFSVGDVVMFVNLFIFAWGGLVYTWHTALASMVAYYIAAKVMDLVIQGSNESKSVWIISDNSKELGDTISARLGRGVTYLAGEGGFSGEDKKVIFCVINRLEEAKLINIVKEIDPTSFLAIADVAEVRGGKFKKNDIH